jgi:hypothetical protein
MCFCPSCRQTATIAGYDPDQAARSALVHAERAWNAAPGVENSVRADELLAAYRRVRAEANQAWLRRLMEQHASVAWFAEHLCDDAVVLPPEMARIIHVADRPSAERLAASELQRRVPNEFGVSAPVWQPAFAEASELVAWVSDAVRRGIWHFDFRGLDEAPADTATWLRQAVRFARRESDKIGV